MTKTTLAALASTVALSTTSALAATGEMSYTPTSFKLPIYTITLSSSTSASTSAVIYSCSGTTDAACAIDVASDAAIAAALATGTQKSISSGTYDTIALNNCASGASSYSLQVKGTATVGGTPYYTALSAATTSTGGSTYTGSANPLTTTIGSNDYVTHTVGSCSNKFPIGKPIVVGSGTQASVTVSLYATLTRVAAMLVGVTDNTSTGQMNCVLAGSNYHCINLPTIIPFLGADTPTAEKYQFWDSTGGGAGTSTTTQANGEIALIFDSTGTTFLGGFTNVIMNATSLSMPTNYLLSGFATPLYSLTLASSTTSACPPSTAAANCTMTGTGSSGPTATGGMVINNFQRLPVNGTFSSALTGTTRAINGSTSTLGLFGTRVQ
ncbi:MAG: hypothetical protein ACXVBW_02005 [Bdellovibrionota bacterium]